ncbi:hypothetical protein DNAM_500 [Pseudomonas phage BroderSalsa]|nr:hypothetical protein DNAM_500 [Pseudomonas phage BroderSalsa]
MSLSIQTSSVVTLENTVATRSYPFTQETLDQIQDIRKAKEREMNEASNQTFVVPAPVVIAEAIALLHEDYFP